MSQGNEAAAGGDSISPLSVASFALRYRRVLFGLPVLAFGISIVTAIVFGVGYASRSSFVPQPRESGASRVSALAAQFALLAGGSDSGESVEFYAQLLRSHEMLTQAVLSTYAVPGGPGGRDTARGTLVDLWEPSGANVAARARAAVHRLDRQLSISTSREANSVTLVTRAESPELAVQINRRLLELVSEFNLQKRRSRAEAEREFTAGRVREAQQELETAEDAQRRFLEQNRQYQASPQLRFEAARLERRVSLRQQVHQSLAESYEQARIEEVRDTPVVTVVDRPEFDVRRARSRLVDAIVWALVAAILALGLALGNEYLAREKSGGGRDYGEFMALVRDSGAGRVWRRLRHRKGTRSDAA